MQNKSIESEKNEIENENENETNEKTLTEQLVALLTEKVDYNQRGFIAIGKLLMVLEDEITKSIAKEQYKSGPGFVQLHAKDEWEKELNGILPKRAKGIIVELQEELTSIMLPLTLKDLERILNSYNIRNKKMIKVLWDLIQKYLIKDGTFYIPEL